jgi:hypothetical protein
MLYRLLGEVCSKVYICHQKHAFSRNSRENENNQHRILHLMTKAIFDVGYKLIRSYMPDFMIRLLEIS